MTKIDEEKARQGQRGTPILMILIIALALCAIVFVGMQFYGASEPDSALTDGGSTTSETAPAAADSQSNGEVVKPSGDGVTGTDTGSN